MDINYELPNYFDGTNALTTPSVGVDNRGRSLVDRRHVLAEQLGHQFVPRDRDPLASTSARRRCSSLPPRWARRSTRRRSPARSRTSSISNAFSMGGGGNNNAKYDYTTFPDRRRLRHGSRRRTRSRSASTSCTSVMSVFNTQYSNGQFTFDGTVTGLSLADFLIGRVGPAAAGRRCASQRAQQVLRRLRAGRVEGVLEADAQLRPALGAVFPAAATTTTRCSSSTPSGSRGTSGARCTSTRRRGCTFPATKASPAAHRARAT